MKHLKGNRCEVGRWCEKATCYHGGLCEEGDIGPACRCHGYHGPLCEVIFFLIKTFLFHKNLTIERNRILILIVMN